MSGEKERARDPLRFLTKLRRSLRKRELARKFGQEWTTNSEGFQNRRYGSYEAYLEHQKAKLEIHSFGDYDSEFRKTLRDRLGLLDLRWPGSTVLCLGARIGTEVKAFLDLGCFAIGIDLNPGKENRYVVHGDFHDLQFAPGSVDVVYTNSLDHVFDITRLAGEVRKVLKPGGTFILEAVEGRAQGVNPGFFESFFWNQVDDLVRIFETARFVVVNRLSIKSPWPGSMICFMPAPKPEQVIGGN